MTDPLFGFLASQTRTSGSKPFQSLIGACTTPQRDFIRDSSLFGRRATTTPGYSLSPQLRVRFLYLVLYEVEGFLGSSPGTISSAMATPEGPVQPGSGTLLLILIQVASRALTFIGNQFLLRFLSPTLLGISVQLELVSVTSLYFARDSLRVALQRQTLASSTVSGDDNGKPEANGRKKRTQRTEASLQAQMVVNLAYLSILIGLAISVVFGYSYLTSANTEALSSSYFTLSFRIYAFATLLELFAEPSFLFIQQKALYKERARAETAAAMARCLTACFVAALGHNRRWDPSILPFAIGQAAYSIVLLALYLLPTLESSRRDNFSLFPARLATSDLSSISTRNPNYVDLFPKYLLSLAGTMYLQSIFKLLLTQGDALILSFLSTLADQGAFALASNYGGLLARLVFQPVEESSRNTFGRLLSSDKRTKSQGGNDGQRPALTYLANILHFYLIFSLPLVTLAPYIFPLVVRHILSASWYTQSTALLLSTYCYYIPFMAVNGILDAFVTSVATPAQLRRQSLWMVACTAIYGVAAWVLLTKSGLGASGLIWANMVNMALRVVWSLWFIAGWTREQGGGSYKQLLGEAVPSIASTTTAGAIVLGLRIYGTNTESFTREVFGVLATGAVLLGSTM